MTLEKPSIFALTGIIGYILVSCALWIYCTKTTDVESYQQGVFMYGFLSPFFFYVFNTESKSKFLIYTFWLTVGIGHLIAYWYLKDDIDLQMLKVHASKTLLYTLPFAFLYQILRIASYKLQGTDLIMIYRGSNPTATPIDYAAFFIFLGLGVLLTVI